MVRHEYSQILFVCYVDISIFVLNVIEFLAAISLLYGQSPHNNKHQLKDMF